MCGWSFIEYLLIESLNLLTLIRLIRRGFCLKKDVAEVLVVNFDKKIVLDC